MSNTPSDADIENLAAEHLKAFSQFPMGGQVWFEGEVEFARAVLAKWGTTASVGVEPIGVVGYTVHGTQYVNWLSQAPAHGTPIYATPQPTQAQAGAVPLTDEQILNRENTGSSPGTAAYDLELARFVEAAHGIKGGQHGD